MGIENKLKPIETSEVKKSLEDNFSPIKHLKEGFLSSKDMIFALAVYTTFSLTGITYLAYKGSKAYDQMQLQPTIYIKQIEEDNSKSYLILKDRETRERFYCELKNGKPEELNKK